MGSGNRHQRAVVLGVRQTEELQEAQGVDRDAAGREVEGVMPFLDVALDHNRKAMSKRQTSSTWAPGLRPCNSCTSATATAAGCWTAG